MTSENHVKVSIEDDFFIYCSNVSNCGIRWFGCLQTHVGRYMRKNSFDGRPPIHLSILQNVITLTSNEAVKLHFLQNAGNLFYHNLIFIGNWQSSQTVNHLGFKGQKLLLSA